MLGIFLSTQTEQEKTAYIGAQKCALCHQDKSALHSSSPHGMTWRPASALDRIESLPQEIKEANSSHAVRKLDGRWNYILKMGDRPPQIFPIHSVVGGERFGLSFLFRAEKIESAALPRPTLIEGRYMLDHVTSRLKRSPGFPELVEDNYEVNLGRVLSRDFADKCLSCHLGPLDYETALKGEARAPLLDNGVTCERCHGPGEAHLEAVSESETDLKIIHPGKLPSQQLMELCGDCHSGFFPLLRPRPGDVLIANQATAMVNSECYLESNGAFTCLSCHDPHRQAKAGEEVYEAVCLGCHAPSEAKRTQCPVNPRSGCISCHMPEDVQPGNFHLIDHWIRVVGE